MLEVRDVDVTYGDIQALWGVSFSVRKGEMVALVGSNGAGKSTVLRTLSGVQKPRKGTITVGGTRSDTVDAHKVVELGVSLVPEGRRLFRDMTILRESGAWRLHWQGAKS